MELNEWTNDIEREVRSYRHDTARYAWIYEKMSKKYQSIISNLTLFISILTALIGVEGIFGLQKITPLWVRIISIIVSFITATVILSRNAFKFDQIQIKSAIAHVNFSILNRIISFQLINKTEKRRNGREFLRDIMEQMERYKQTAPVIDEKIKKDYYAYHYNPPSTRENSSDGNYKPPLQRRSTYSIANIPQNTSISRLLELYDMQNIPPLPQSPRICERENNVAMRAAIRSPNIIEHLARRGSRRSLSMQVPGLVLTNSSSESSDNGGEKLRRTSLPV